MSLQDTFGRQHADFERSLLQQREEFEQANAELTGANQELQRQLQLFQLRCDQVTRLAAIHKLSRLLWLSVVVSVAPDGGRITSRSGARAEAIAGQTSDPAADENKGAAGCVRPIRAGAPALPARPQLSGAASVSGAQRPAVAQCQCSSLSAQSSRQHAHMSILR